MQLHEYSKAFNHVKRRWKHPRHSDCSNKLLSRMWDDLGQNAHRVLVVLQRWEKTCVCTGSSSVVSVLGEYVWV